MDAENYPDPVREAVHHGLNRAMQVTSWAATAAQVLVYHQRAQARLVAERDERARRALSAQIRAERDAARAGWAPALDRQWLGQAGLYDVARVWGAAVPYADRNVPWYEPTAASALRSAAERLRELHPYAMARYDRLRDDGLSPAEAMRQAAPLFARHPRAHNPPYRFLPVLEDGTGVDATWTSDVDATSAEADDSLGLEAMERRGRDIAAALQEQTATRGRRPLGPAELSTVLEATTNLPADIISRLSREVGVDGQAQPGLKDAATVPASQGRRPWEVDFPVPIRDVVAAAGIQPTQPAPLAPAARRVTRQAPPVSPGHVR